MELRQLRYFVRLAEELNFGRAAAKEHIVQSALSQQIQRLERELGLTLVRRDTHRVDLTPAGEVFTQEARAILEQVRRASNAAHDAADSVGSIRVAVGDPSLDSMPRILRHAQEHHPQLVIHRVEASVPSQYRMLLNGTLDMGIGRASQAPATISSAAFRLDKMGVLVPASHPLGTRKAIGVAELEGVPFLFRAPGVSPEFDEFVIEVCRNSGFLPTLAHGSAHSIYGAADLLVDQKCLMFVPQSCGLRKRGLHWLPLVEPTVHYPWSLLWRTADTPAAVSLIRDSARALTIKHRWMTGAAKPPLDRAT